jgi:subtilisin family serine protease
MTRAAPIAPPGLAAMQAAAAAAGLAVSAAASWPEPDDDREVRPLAGFIVSTFSPLLAEVAERALGRRGEPPPGLVTALVIVTARGDVTSAADVAATVDAGGRVGPLMFFQAVPNTVVGYVAARWGLTGPVACVGDITAGLDVARLLIDDADADEVLVVWAEEAGTGQDRDQAAAVVVADAAGTKKEQPG